MLARTLADRPDLRDHRFEVLPYAELPGATLLHYACEFGATACIRELLDRGASVNALSDQGMTPLLCAARGGSPADVTLLLDRGAHGWMNDNAGRTAADHARAAVGHRHRETLLRVLTQVGFDNERMRRAVELIDGGDVELLAAMLAAEPGLATARVEGDSAITRGYFHRPTLLHFVAGNPGRGDHLPPRIVESTRALLDAGAEIDACTGDAPGVTTLALVASSAAAHRDGLVRPLIELLVARGADPAAALGAAILHRFRDTTRLLLALGAPCSAVAAAGLGDLAALRSLLSAGLSVDELVHAGWAAAANGQPAALDALINAGLDVDVRLPRPFAPTMLHEAAWHDERAACEQLVARGADRTLRDQQYDGTASDWARHAGHEALSFWLATADCAE